MHTRIKQCLTLKHEAAYVAEQKRWQVDHDLRVRLQHPVGDMMKRRTCEDDEHPP